MKIVLLSDTHGKHKQLSVPEGDMIIHAGDLTPMGRHRDVVKFLNWYSQLPHKYKILISGNHDFYFQDNDFITISRETGLSINPKVVTGEQIVYIQDAMIEVEGIKIYGSPWTPTFFHWAFMLDRGESIRQKWNALPEGMDIIVTHGPPRGILDNNRQNFHAGCDDLLERMKVVKPKYHVFGHMHEGHGVENYDGITYINPSILNDDYMVTNNPIVINI